MNISKQELEDLLFSIKYCAGSCHHTTELQKFGEKYDVTGMVKQLVEYQNEQSDKVHQYKLHVEMDKAPVSNARYELVEDSIFDLKEEFESGNLYYQIRGSWQVIPTLRMLEYKLSCGACYRRIAKSNDIISCEGTTAQSINAPDSTQSVQSGSTTHYVIQVGDGYVCDYTIDSVTQLLRDFTLTNSLSEAYTTVGRSEAIDLAYEVGGLVYKL